MAKARTSDLLTIRCPGDLLQAIVERAEATGQSKTDVVVQALRLGLGHPLESQHGSAPFDNGNGFHPGTDYFDKRFEGIERKLVQQNEETVQRAVKQAKEEVLSLVDTLVKQKLDTVQRRVKRVASDPVEQHEDTVQQDVQQAEDNVQQPVQPDVKPDVKQTEDEVQQDVLQPVQQDVKPDVKHFENSVQLDVRQTSLRNRILDALKNHGLEANTDIILGLLGMPQGKKERKSIASTLGDLVKDGLLLRRGSPEDKRRTLYRVPSVDR